VLDLDTTAGPIWDHFFSVAPLVVIGTRSPSGEPDLAPKHMAGPASWDNYFAFVCAASHKTLGNCLQSGSFSVSYPRPDQVLLAALAASPRSAECSKSDILSRLPVREGQDGDPLLLDASLHLHCKLHKHLEVGPNVLVIGQVVSAAVHPDAMRRTDEDDHDRIQQFPLLAYVTPGRYAVIEESQAFPFPRDYSR